MKNDHSGFFSFSFILLYTPKITPNGIVNPAMSDVNSEVPSWSDTSSENIKGNSRASTLTRETKSDDLGSPEKTINIKEAKEKSNSFPRYTSLSSHNEPLKDPAPYVDLNLCWSFGFLFCFLLFCLGICISLFINLVLFILKDLKRND